MIYNTNNACDRWRATQSERMYSTRRARRVAWRAELVVPDREDGNTASAARSVIRRSSNAGDRTRTAGTSGSLAVVNGLRGWAIAGVVWHHVGQPVLTPSGFASQDIGGYLMALQALLSYGSFGVSLFFVLSGLVLALPYARGLRQMASPADVRAYYTRRAWRLLPLYYLVIGVSLFMRPLDKISTGVFLNDALSLATFTFSFDETRWFTWYDPVLWSL